MPPLPLIALLLCVISAAGLTIWLLGLGSPAIAALALPVGLALALVLRRWRR